MPQQSRLSVLLTELKRRRVFRVAAVPGEASRDKNFELEYHDCQSLRMIRG